MTKKLTINDKYRVRADIFTSRKPDYYKVNEKQDLFDVFKSGLLTHEQLVGFILGNLYKYEYRYQNKGQKQSDLNKIQVYAKKLKEVELGE